MVGTGDWIGRCYTRKDRYSRSIVEKFQSKTGDAAESGQASRTTQHEPTQQQRTAHHEPTQQQMARRSQATSPITAKYPLPVRFNTQSRAGAQFLPVHTTCGPFHHLLSRRGARLALNCLPPPRTQLITLGNASHSTIRSTVISPLHSHFLTPLLSLHSKSLYQSLSLHNHSG